MAKLNTKKGLRVSTMKPKTDIVKLQKQVNKLESKLQTGYEKMYLYGSIQDTTVLSNYEVANLSNYNTLAPCFGTSGADYNTVNKWYSKKIHLDIIIDLGNEPDNVSMTIFVVKLKKDTNLYDKSTGAMVTLSATNNYIQNTLNDKSQVYINPKDFKIVFVDDILVGNNGVAIGTSTGPGNDELKGHYRKRISWKTGFYSSNPDGNLQALTCDPDPTHQYYFLLFNNNLGADLQYPTYSLQVLHEIDVPV